MSARYCLQSTQFPLSAAEYHLQVYAAIPLSAVPMVMLLYFQQWLLAAAFALGIVLFCVSAWIGFHKGPLMRAQIYYIVGGAIILLPTFVLGIPIDSIAAVIALLPLVVGVYLYQGLFRWLNIGLSLCCFALAFVVQVVFENGASLNNSEFEATFSWVMFSVFTLFLLVVITRVTTDLRRANGRLTVSNRDAAQERERYQTLFDNAPEAYFILSAKNGAIVECNHGAERMLRASREELMGKLPFELSPSHQPSGERSDVAARALSKRIVELKELTFEWVHQRFDGEPFWAEVEIRQGRYEGETVYFSTWREIDKRKRLESELLKLANEDQLTGLLNRHSLKISFERLLAHAKRADTGITLFYIDLDKFKFVNDSYGHITGDQLLKRVANQFQSSIRRDDLAARLGGDEFLLAFEGDMSIHQIEELVHKLSSPFETPLAIAGHSLKVGLSIGISSFPQDGDDFDTLLRAADNALYKAKDLGRGQHQFFCEEMADKATEHLRIETGIARALERGEFKLVYQQQIALKDRSVYGVEALLRWHDPEQGLIYPETFLSIADDSNQLEQLEAWVLHTAFTQAKTWHDAGIAFGRMAVNLSPRSLQRGYAFKLIKAALESTGCPASLLEAEISENFLLENEKTGVAQLQCIRDLGVELSLDDFGTGFSSLRYIQRMPIDKLKIDKSFVRDIERKKSDLEIVSATIAMAHKLDLRVIAEGVETQAQLEQVEREGCDVAQGYLFSKPVAADELFPVLSQAQ